MSEVSGGKLLAIPYRGLALGPELNSRILQHVVEHPHWFSTPMTPEEIRVLAAKELMSLDHRYWEVWNGGRFAGLLALSHIVPQGDALFHFMIFPNPESGTSLFGARRLLWNFLGYAFRTFDLRRISCQVPEHAPKFVHFVRNRLGFRYEGEPDRARLERQKGLVRLDVPGVMVWLAGHGSRREKAHWNPVKGEWADLHLLRLFRSEYDARASSGTMPQTSRENVTTSHEALPDELARQPEPSDRPAKAHVVGRSHSPR